MSAGKCSLYFNPLKKNIDNREEHCTGLGSNKNAFYISQLCLRILYVVYLG